MNVFLVDRIIIKPWLDIMRFVVVFWASQFHVQQLPTDLWYCYGLSFVSRYGYPGHGKPGPTSFLHLSRPASVLETICRWRMCRGTNPGLGQTLQDQLNNTEPSIQFTVEREINQETALLDAFVCRQDNGQLANKGASPPTRRGISRLSRITRSYLRRLLWSRWPTAHVIFRPPATSDLKS